MEKGDNAKKLAIGLRQYRIRQRLTQRELCRLAGVALATVRCIEQGKSNPQMSTLIRLSEVLHCQPDDLIFKQKELFTQHRAVRRRKGDDEPLIRANIAKM